VRACGHLSAGRSGGRSPASRRGCGPAWAVQGGAHYHGQSVCGPSAANKRRPRASTWRRLGVRGSPIGVSGLRFGRGGLAAAAKAKQQAGGARNRAPSSALRCSSLGRCGAAHRHQFDGSITLDRRPRSGPRAKRLASARPCLRPFKREGSHFARPARLFSVRFVLLTYVSSSGRRVHWPRTSAAGHTLALDARNTKAARFFSFFVQQQVASLFSPAELCTLELPAAIGRRRVSLVGTRSALSWATPLGLGGRSCAQAAPPAAHWERNPTRQG